MSDLFEVEQIAPDIYHLHFTKGERMADALMRIQEYYESPKFRGKYFTREEFLDWYKKEKKGMTYIYNWKEEGFNVPNSALGPFCEGHFDPLTQDEQTILDYFKDNKNHFYIIATAKDSSPGMLNHEIAHALYYLNPEYKKEVDTILSKYDLTAVKTFLTTNPDYASYHEAVLDDETHAYLAYHSDELAKFGVDLAPYKEAIVQLQEVYKKYAPR